MCNDVMVSENRGFHLPFNLKERPPMSRLVLGPMANENYSSIEILIQTEEKGTWNSGARKLAIAICSTEEKIVYLSRCQ